MDPLPRSVLYPRDIVRVHIPGEPGPVVARVLLSVPHEDRIVVEHPYPSGGIVQVTTIPFDSVLSVHRWVPIVANSSS